MKGFVLLVFLAASTICLASGEDSTIVEIDTTHSVKKAVLLSTFVPGAGQVYNHLAMPKGKKKAYWKLPLIYGGLGAASYFLISNQSEQKALKKEYSYRQENDGFMQNEKYFSYSNEGVLTLYNQHLDWRDLSILALAGVYIIQIVDAGVEAHFVSFDISENLSMSLEPTLLYNQTAGITMRFNFR